VSGEIFKHTEGLFRFEALGEKEVKGKEAPVHVYRVLAPSTSRTRFDVSAERGLTPFVGREREFELLLDGFERSKAGRGQAFSIIAEAGIGKSRLLYEFRKSVAHEDVTFLEGKCLSYSKDVPYHLLIDSLKANFDILEGDRDSVIREKVIRGLEILRVDEGSTLPYFLELFSVKDSGIDKIPMSPEAKKDRIIEALKQISLKGSEIRPLILAYEDLHWADKSSEVVLKNFLESIPGARVLMIFTYRPDFVHTWGGKSYHNQLTLNRLSNSESLLMVSHLLGTEELDKDLEEFILEKTEGVPFFIEELIKSLKDLKILKREDNRYRIAKDIKEVIIPATVQDVIMARIDSLPEEAKSLLQKGSVAGREFSHDLLKQVTNRPKEELLSHLSILKDSELLYERGIYPQSTYIFKHALIQDATYQSLLKSTRQKYHQKIAQVLEKYFADTMETQPELLAHHYTEAGLFEQAVGYWHQAGKRATQRSANVEAINHLTKGLEVLMNLPDTFERARQELDLQTTLGPVVMAVKGFGAPEVGKVYDRARELCQKVGETPQLFRSLFGMWLYYCSKELQTAQKIGEQLRTIAQRAKDPALNLQAHHALWTHSLFLGNFLKTREHAEQGMIIYDPQQHHSHAFIYAGHDPGVCCRYFGATAMWFLGYPVSHPPSLGIVLTFAARLHLFRREAKATQEVAEAAIALCSEHGLAMFLNWATIMLGWALAAQGKEDEGIAQMHHGMYANLTAVIGVHKPCLLAHLAETYGRIGKADAGMTSLAEAMASAEKIGANWWTADMHRLKGELLFKLSPENLVEVETCYNHALKVARRQKAKSLELRAAMSLSRLWQQQGKQEEANQLLSEIYGWFTEGFDTADLKEAKFLLEELA
jgi:predicted ATPase